MEYSESCMMILLDRVFIALGTSLHPELSDDAD